jgi:hypothetical protein
VSVNINSNRLTIEQKLLSVANKKLENGKTILQDGKFDFGTICSSASPDKARSNTYEDKENKKLKSLLSLFDPEAEDSNLTGLSASSRIAKEIIPDVKLSELLLGNFYLSRLCDRYEDRHSDAMSFTSLFPSTSKLLLLSTTAESDIRVDADLCCRGSVESGESFPCTPLISEKELDDWTAWFRSGTKTEDSWFTEPLSLSTEGFIDPTSPTANPTASFGAADDSLFLRDQFDSDMKDLNDLELIESRVRFQDKTDISIVEAQDSLNYSSTVGLGDENIIDESNDTQIGRTASEQPLFANDEFHINANQEIDSDVCIVCGSSALILKVVF